MMVVGRGCVRLRYYGMERQCHGMTVETVSFVCGQEDKVVNFQSHEMEYIYARKK